MYAYAIIFFVVICTGVVYFAATTYENFDSTIPESGQSEPIQNEKPKLTCIVSSENGDTYCVRDTNKQVQAAALLSRIAAKGQLLIDSILKKYPDDPIGKQLQENFDATAIKEVMPNSAYTAFTQNKGETIEFCLTQKKDQEDVEGLIPEHTLMFVFLHEISHLANKSIGHGPEFWAIFRKILVFAREFKIHEPLDYKLKNKEYCGTKISDNPYFDM